MQDGITVLIQMCDTPPARILLPAQVLCLTEADASPMTVKAHAGILRRLMHIVELARNQALAGPAARAEAPKRAGFSAFRRGNMHQAFRSRLRRAGAGQRPAPAGRAAMPGSLP